MISKDKLLKSYKKHYKPTFLLSYARFLTYKELAQTNNIDAVDESMSEKEWNKTVIEYNENNVKNALCISLDIAFKDIIIKNAELMNLYYSDILEWLKILENNDINLPKKINKKELYNFYMRISDYYNFKLQYEL